MKDALKHKDEIRKRIAAKGAVVMLDFDGTLVAFEPKIDQVRMGVRMRRAFTACARRYPTAVITGRAIASVRQHIRMRSIALVGNHGLEWDLKGERGAVTLSAASTRALEHMYRSLKSLRKDFPGALVENKKYSICFHYRMVKKALQPEAVRAARQLVRKVKAPSFRIVEGEYVLNVLPRRRYNKGTAARMIAKRLGRPGHPVPIFIGDDVTDEDAFRTLSHGVTVHVKNGKHAKSAARYYLRDIQEVGKFLHFISRI